MRYGVFLASLLAACSSPPALHTAVENRAAPAAMDARPNACPRMTLLDGEPWQHLAFPQCPSEPFETDMPICAGRACPRPCRVIEMNPGLKPTATFDVRYDDAGRWIATVPSATSPPSEQLREATYHGDRMQSVHRHNADTDYTETLEYTGGRLARTRGGLDGDIELTYDGDRVVQIAQPNDTMAITYDPAGRVITNTTHSTTYHYDGDGQLAALDNDYDHRRFSYDVRHRLVRIDSVLGGGDASASTVVITYDRFDRVVRVATDTTVDIVYHSTTTYDYCD